MRNVAVTEAFTHSEFHSIEEKVFQKRIKESPWCSMEMVFRTAVL